MATTGRNRSKCRFRLFFGTYLLGDAENVSYFDEPVDYYGNLLTEVDPATLEGFELVESNQDSWYKKPHDLSVRFELEDGSVVHRLIATSHEARADGDHGRFGVNIPLEIGERVERAELVLRPFGGNDPDTQLGDATPDTFFDDVQVLAEWSP